MNFRVKTAIAAILGSIFLSYSMDASAYQDYTEDSSGSGLSHRMYLGFSAGDGAYFNYKCTHEVGCRTTIVAPLDFELILGFQIFQNFYLDVAVNWSVDYYKHYYDEVTYLVGVRPGIRFYLPGLFHRHFYFRGAVPLQYTLDEANNFVVGLLLGFGLEWRFQQVGVFVEADIMPYFLEVYPGYYVIPTQVRAGVSFMF